MFPPDPSQPNKNVFINKTPVSGYCADYPGQCAAKQYVQHSAADPFRFQPPYAAQVTVIRFKVPANWRPLTVTNTETQETETVEVRITGVGSQYIPERFGGQSDRGDATSSKVIEALDRQQLGLRAGTLSVQWCRVVLRH